MEHDLNNRTHVLVAIDTATQAIDQLWVVVSAQENLDKKLRRLETTLNSLSNHLKRLKSSVDIRHAMLIPVQDPVSHCGEVCGEFRASMIEYMGESTADLVDWDDMTFMMGYMSNFLDCIECYESTISIVVGAITLEHGGAAPQVLQQYEKLIKATKADLKKRSVRIDRKLKRHVDANIAIELRKEKDMMQQCLRVCEGAHQHLQDLIASENSNTSHVRQDTTASSQDKISIHEQGIISLNRVRDTIFETRGRIKERLDRLPVDGSPECDRERSKLLDELEGYSMFAENCKNGSIHMSSLNIHRYGRIVAEEGSRQVVINTYAGLFDIQEAIARRNATRAAGSMKHESIAKLIEHGYDVREVNGGNGNVSLLPTDFDTSDFYSVLITLGTRRIESAPKAPLRLTYSNE
ncbi:hypothetical protein BX600DRAFT_385838 [Xylariales sp. PMI_506]|nr:hypothetical protein BX600DRAFT_385838 [Xylariales sp. PMI_506]